MRSFRSWLLLLGSVAVATMAFVVPETPLEKLKQQLEALRKQYPSTCLYLHTDKNRYAPNEDIWFKAYVLSGNIIDNQVLYVRLADENRRIVLSDQFPVYDIRAHGDMLLPDTLKDGTYYLFAYTDRMINFSDDDIFMQPITVSRDRLGRLEAEASVVDTTKMKRGEKIDILVTVRQGGDLQQKVKGQYFLSSDGKEIRNGRITTNDFGEATISFVYPALDDRKSLQVKVRFDRDGDQASVDLNLRHEKNPVNVQGFAEGGHLVAGVQNRLVIAATDINRLAVSTKVDLLNNGQPAGSAVTDRFGLASIDFVPAVNAVYTLKESGANDPVPLAIPVEPSGFALSMVQDEDATDVTISNLGMPAEGILIVRTYEKVVWDMPISVPNGKAIKVNMPLEELPKGVLSLGLLDAAGNALAERFFMNKRNDDDYHLVLKADKPSYGPRKNVHVAIDIKNREKEPVAANISVAVVQRNRFDETSYRNILDYYDSRFLDRVAPVQVLAAMSDNTRDALLIAKSWQRSRLTDVLSFSPGERVNLLSNTAGITGRLEPLTRKSKKAKPQDLVIYSKRSVATAAVNADYSFSIPPEYLVTQRGNEHYLVQGDDFRSKYKVHFDDYDLAYDKKVRDGEVLRVPQRFSTLAHNKLPPKVKSSLSSGIQLAEIQIRSDGQSNGIRIFRSTTCDDYVCVNNILNCQNHINAFGNFSPMEGAVYVYRTGGFGGNMNSRQVIYRGCGRVGNTSVIKNISIPKRFFLPDYDKQPSYEPELRTTIYWNPNTGTTKEGVNNLQFFTSDIKGEFIVIAQGIDVNTLQPIYGTTTFTVK